ncbi:MAG: hypothetical protein CMJ22_05070 [Phycisphaerae bacterium]|nr:hypothetical protein [Phycisphaerae bacterium]
MRRSRRKVSRPVPVFQKVSMACSIGGRARIAAAVPGIGWARLTPLVARSLASWSRSRNRGPKSPRSVRIISGSESIRSATR